VHPGAATAATRIERVELVCPAGSLPALKAAVDEGADWVYLGLRDQTNARNFAGPNFDEAALAAGLAYAHARGRKVLLALNTYPQAATWARWTQAVDLAAGRGVDAIIVADLGLLDYAHRRHPRLELHLSVQGSATSHEAINFYHERFGVRRAVLPRVLSLAQVENVVRHTPVEIEVFGFGGLCVMVEGRCALSAYACGLLMELGAARWVAPIEVTREMASSVLAAQPIEAEVFAYGRLPLAFSARCFTARRFNLQKEQCEYRCLGFRDGMPLKTREGEPFLTINGVQTQSALVYNLIREIGSLKDAGVTILRASPQSQGMVDVLHALRAACDGAIVPATSLAGSYCDGFWHGRPGLERAA